MAQKATKQLATRNTAILRRTHLVSLAINLLFLISRLLLFRRSLTSTTHYLYFALSLPSFLIEFWLEKIGRPTLSPENGSVLKSGEDLEAKGLTEWMWDILYWTWACVIGAAILGDRFWWAWAVAPVYSGYLAWKTFMGVRGGMGGLMEGGGESGGMDGQSGGESKRQKKMEKRGGQKMQYR